LRLPTIGFALHKSGGSEGFEIFSELSAVREFNYKLVPIHKSISGTNQVSNAKMSNFLQGQDNQGITRPALRWEQVIPQIDPREIGAAFHPDETN
jgi:hypothetical protein